MKRTWLHALLTMLCLGSFNLMADSRRQPVESIPDGPVQLPDNVLNRAHTWTGIGRLRGDNTSYCTATLIDTRDTSRADANSPAYIITSHRCLNTKVFGQYTYAGGVLHNLSMKGHVYFNHFDNTVGQLKGYAFKHVVWQSNEGLNVAIIELDAPLATLIADGIHPMKIANSTPPTGTEILALGIPDFSSLHARHCTQLPTANIATYPWVSTQLLTNACSALTPGGYGGPVINRASNELISILVASTHSTEGKNRCLTDTPCELIGNTSHWRPATHYSRPVSFLNQCFVSGVLTPERPECSLYKMTSVKLTGAVRPPARILELLATDKDFKVDQFEVKFAIDSLFYRYQYTHDANACHSGHNYSEAIAATDPSILLTLNNTVGMHMLCIIGVDSPTDRLSNAQFDAAKIIAIERLAAKPAHTPDMNLLSVKNNGEYWIVRWKHDALLLDRYEVKYGPYETVDCTNPEGYEEIPDYEVLKRDSGPWEQIYTHKDHPTDPALIMIKKNKDQLENGLFIKRINAHHRAMKMCTILYNAKKEPSAPRTDILRPL